ncbi:MAG TPA: J domain-containing protein [Labilithrix sp.]|nr:J domain-containing protein [Labilithrix sp.]
MEAKLRSRGVRTFDEFLQAAMNEAATGPARASSTTGCGDSDVVAQVAAAAARAALVPATLRLPAWAVALDVSLPCSEQSLKQAFRRRAFETHPDRPGGSHEAFLSTRAAYEDGLAAVRAGRGAVLPASASASSYRSRPAPARPAADVAVA